MSRARRTSATEFRASFPVWSDDPEQRIRAMAENRAVRNNRDPREAGRAAIKLLQMTRAIGLEPETERIITIVAGEYQSKKTY